MEQEALIHMTKWQFYAEFAVQFVLGIGFCYAMYELSLRNPILGWTPNKTFDTLRSKLGMGLIVLAGVFSYFALPTVYHAFLDDVEMVVDSTVDKAVGDVVDGKTPSDFGLSGSDNVNGNPAEVIWGEPNETQRDTFKLMSGFFIALGLCCYVWNFHASRVGVGKKLLKVFGYTVLSIVPLFQPMKLHRFTWDEVQTEVVCLIIAGVCIVLSHDWSKLPPPVPETIANKGPRGAEPPEVPQLP